MRAEVRDNALSIGLTTCYHTYLEGWKFFHTLEDAVAAEAEEAGPHGGHIYDLETGKILVSPEWPDLR